MKIIKDISPATKTYRFTHRGCCIFEARGDEFNWTTGQYNETVANVICPKCGRQFYADPELIGEETLNS